MKQLFYEHEKVGTFEHAWVNSYGDVDRHSVTVYATCIAHWDQKLSVLVIDLACNTSREYEEDWLPAGQRVFETQPTQASALRSVIAHADAFSQRIDKAMPVGDAHRSDDDVKRALQIVELSQ